MLDHNQLTVFIPSGAGAPGFAGICRCLRDESTWKILAGDVNENAYGKSLADAFFVVPPSDQTEAYLSVVHEICEKFSVDVILPITTRELHVLSKHKSQFEDKGIRVIVSEEAKIDVANDKGKTAAVAKELGIPVPENGVCCDRKSLQETTLLFFKRVQSVCFKPVLGNGSRGFGIISQEIERGGFLKSKASILPMSLEEWLIRLPEKFDTPLLLSDFLPGAEYSVDLLCDRGKTLFCIPRTREKMIGGISVQGKVERNFGLIAFCIRLAQALELDGPIGMQWKEDQQGIPHLIEINPRLQGTTSALALAGINIPVQAVRLALGMELSGSTADILWGHRFVRFWDERITE